MARAPAFVLLRVDPPRHLARRIAALVELHRRHDALDHAQLVVRIQDLEALRQRRLAPVQAQQAVREAVEGADPHAARAAAQQRFDAPAHLRRGLVGEGDREHAVRRHADHLDQPADAMGQHARLAGAGAGEHQVVAGRGGNDVALGGIEFVEQVRDIHPAIVVARRGGSFASISAKGAGLASR